MYAVSAVAPDSGVTGDHAERFWGAGARVCRSGASLSSISSPAPGRDFDRQKRAQREGEGFGPISNGGIVLPNVLVNTLRRWGRALRHVGAPARTLTLAKSARFCACAGAAQHEDLPGTAEIEAELRNCFPRWKKDYGRAAILRAFANVITDPELVPATAKKALTARVRAR